MQGAKPGEAVHHNRSGGRAAGGALSLLLIMALVAADLARADEPPAFRRGLWQFDRTIGGQALQTKSCTSPTEDLERQNAILEKGGCKSSPGKRSGDVYMFTVECTVTTPGSGTVTVHSTSVMTVESDSAYNVDIKTTGAGTSTQERLVARRIGDCEK
jgi:hypothetical protein